MVTAVNVHAQALYGSLVGNVVDETGAVVPGATVTITQRETNQTREQTTPDNGAYSFPNLAPGTYDVVVTLPGFKTFSSRDITVNIGAIVRVDARLALGTLEESVVVTGEAAILQADSAALQSVTTAQALENLPINGRSYQSLLTLTPGVSQPSYFQTGGINNPSRSMQVSVNGQPNTNTAFRLDGMSITNQWIPGTSGLQSRDRSDRNREHRHEQLRGRPGDGRWRRRERAGQERHEFAARFGIRILRARESSREELLPAGHQREAEGDEEHLRRHDRRANQARTSFSTSSASRRRIRGRWAGRSSDRPRCCCRCLRPSSGPEISPALAR